MLSKKSKLLRKIPGPVVLLIWDGFGLSKHISGNAEVSAHMPVWHDFLSNYSKSELRADGEAVGLPKFECGNSEVGHATIGAGRAVPSDTVLINQAIKDKSFFDNTALLMAAAHVIEHGSTLHLMGLLTNRQSGHAAYNHIVALIKFAERLKLPKVVLHLFTDGRDTEPFHALKLLGELEAILPENFKVGSVSGRFYSMDRDRNWGRTGSVYSVLTRGEGVVADSAAQAIEQGYARGESDEFLMPTSILQPDGKVLVIDDHDAVIFWKLRTDRARQLTKPFVQHDFELKEERPFKRSRKVRDLCFVTMTEFGKQINGDGAAITAFPHHEISGTLVEALRTHKQIYISESEKYAQVTYFMDGGYDAPRFGEERVRIPSQKVSSFDRAPNMRAKEISKAVVSAVNKGHDFVCANFANADMVAHTGNFDAAVLACEALDKALLPIWKAVKKKRGALMITADHGNVEEMASAHGAIDTHHNPNPVHFVCASPKINKQSVRKGTLADIAPTILDFLGVDKPKEMKGHALVK